MTIKKYIERKNVLSVKQTGIVLVPLDQIIDMEPMHLSFTKRDSGACPYCIKWMEVIEGYKMCKGCPMEEMGNECGADKGNTYSQATDALEGSLIDNLEGLEELIKEYNMSNGFPL